MREEERGFTLVEMLISAAVMVMVSMSVLMLVKSSSAVLAARVGEQNAGIALSAQVNRMQSDASAADAIWAPNPNEVDFYSLNSASDGSNTVASNAPRKGLYWSYVYDPSTQTLGRYDYVPMNGMGMRRVTATAGYTPIRGVSNFSVQTVTADKVLAGIPAHAYPVNVGGSGITGGNALTKVRITTQAGMREVHLLPGNMPSGFTIANAVTYKGIVYRVDLTHRACLGLCGKTHVLIKGEVFVSYDGWKTKAPWCDYQIYRDTNEVYSRSDPREQPDHMRSVCATLFNAPLPKPNPDGSLPKGLPPALEAPDTWYDGGVGNEGHSWLSRCAPAVLFGGVIGGVFC
jgi:prepilin-type N-terminal cleavage/methylation domain-containing protein